MFLAVNMAPGIILNALVYILVFLIGITIFSYLNIVIESIGSDDEKDVKKEKLLKGRSKCPHCGHAWKVTEAFPVFSWLKYKKCPYCFEEISPRQTIVELVGGIVAIVPLIYYGVTLQAAFVIIIYAVLTFIAITDIDTKRIPLVTVIILGVLGILSYFVIPGAGIIERAIGAVCISIPMLIIAIIIPKGFGGGDVKLMVAVGILLGWKGAVVAFLIASVIGIIAAIISANAKKKDKTLKTTIAFGPFLAFGTAVALYANCGRNLIDLIIGLVIK